MDTPGTTFLKEFQQLHIISVLVQHHDPMSLDLHQEQIKLSALKTGSNEWPKNTS
jgi:hypothetical protein